MNLREKERFQLHIEVRDAKTSTLIQHTVGIDFTDARVEGIKELNDDQLLEFSAGGVAALYHNMMANLIERIKLENPEFLVNLDKEKEDGNNKETH